mmetsp:Transcript_1998/g.3114  ORF Transcript_1998/g.3114 Transcript_1998/m.3114 type:complete len:184 (-) Transcript_1998:1020-1571(-)
MSSLSPAIESAFESLAGGHASGRGVLPAEPIPAGASVTMGGVDIKLSREKDQQSEDRQKRAQRVATFLEEQLKGALPPKSADSTTELSVYARITMASEGGRAGRICCAELGMGHSKLVIQCLLVDGSGTVLLGERRGYHDSGGCGFWDMFSAEVGDRGLDKNVQVFVSDFRSYLDGEIKKSSS